jgi:hypothetical protein
MSLKASFFLISKTKFEEYCQLAHSVFPKDPQEAIKKPSIRIVMGTDELLLQKKEQFQKIRNFLREFGEQPYVFKRHGESLSDALCWLRQTKNIDLCQIQYRDPSDTIWILFDESLKERYSELINPKNFEAGDLADYVQRVIQGYGRDPSEDPSDDELATELSEAMMDGIKILYDYLRLADSSSVVMLYLGG